MKIEYEIREYAVDETDLSASHVAKAVELPTGQVFKTLVVRGDRTGVVMAVVPGDAELDLKALASVSVNKRMEMVHLNEVLPLTGYIRGGVSPLGAKKSYPVFLDESAGHWPLICISGGQRGTQIVLRPQDLIKATGAILCPLRRIDGNGQTCEDE